MLAAYILVVGSGYRVSACVGAADAALAGLVAEVEGLQSVSGLEVVLVLAVEVVELALGVEVVVMPLVPEVGLSLQLSQPVPSA